VRAGGDKGFFRRSTGWYAFGSEVGQAVSLAKQYFYHSAARELVPDMKRFAACDHYTI
jgi:hypothetical protein